MTMQAKVPKMFSVPQYSSTTDYEESLRNLLESDLDFHGSNGRHSTHAWHPFPAKFPPLLPQTFIQKLTLEGEIVFDPMMGSGTTLVEAVRFGRVAVGCDIDPLARLITEVKLRPPDYRQAMKEGSKIAFFAMKKLNERKEFLLSDIERRFDSSTKDFVDYWFLRDTQIELLSLLLEIEKVKSSILRDFFKMVFSSAIIAKSGGVSLARDLAHTRPHKDFQKKPKPAIDEFCKILRRNLQSVSEASNGTEIYDANADSLPMPDCYADLIVTSPPYANNAIDYMRAHKFSLVWFGYSVGELSRLRSTYIGHDSAGKFVGTVLPDECEKTVSELKRVNSKKASALRRYFCEMRRVIGEMHRVLKTGKAAVMVVGSSVLSGVNTQTHKCLADLGRECGFHLVGIGSRQIDRNRRMMPARWANQNRTSIEKRMHEEHIVGFLKK